jgi:hypothetical protein
MVTNFLIYGYQPNHTSNVCNQKLSNSQEFHFWHNYCCFQLNIMCVEGVYHIGTKN